MKARTGSIPVHSVAREVGANPTLGRQDNRSRHKGFARPRIHVNSCVADIVSFARKGNVGSIPTHRLGGVRLVARQRPFGNVAEW